MKKPFWLFAFAVVVGAGVFFFLRREVPMPMGPTVYVLLDEAHDLSAGDPVTLKDTVIGRVERVEEHNGRVRVAVRLDGTHAKSLPSGSTFTPEGWTRRSLGAHVIDPETHPIENGATLEGCDSWPELLLKQGQQKVSVWMKDAQKAIADIDVSKLSDEVREDLRQVSRELGELTSETGEQARDGYTKIKPKVDRTIQELERLGKSQEAQELKRRFEELLSKTRT